jgi:ABC-type branched-subunit amino acid transport system substrate-binding protein
MWRICRGELHLKIRLKVSIAILVIVYSISGAQEHLEDPVAGMAAAMSDFEKGEYQEAYREFSSLANRFPLDGHNSVFRFMAAKSLYEAGEYEGAISLFDDFLAEFPYSGNAGAALLYKGHSLYFLNDLLGAALAYIAAFDADPGNSVAKTARENLLPLINRGLPVWDLDRLIEENRYSDLAEEMEFTLARRELDAGRYRAGLRTLQSYRRRFTRGKHSREAARLYDQYSEKAEGHLAVGLLAPVSGSYAEFGRSMVEGAQLALKYMTGDSLDLELITRDTGGDPVRAVKAANRLARDEPLAVVGPLRSESSVGAAVVLNDENIPMITPTASEKGIAGLGKGIFQISPALDLLGQAMAEYAIKRLGITEFAIISPDDAGGITVSKAFAQTAYRLGGEVVSTSYYKTGETDFKQQIKPLRDYLLMKTEEQLAAGEIDSSAYLEEPDPEYPDSLIFLDKEEWPVRLGGLFLPGYPDELKLLIPQVRYHIIRTQFLGADGWDSKELIDEVGRYVGDALFATDFHAGSDELNWVEFANAFSSEYKHPPDKVAALTFDAVGLILSGIREGITDPDGLRSFLQNIKDYEGVSCMITFKGTDRANNEIRIYSITEGKVASSR